MDIYEVRRHLLLQLLNSSGLGAERGRRTRLAKLIDVSTSYMTRVCSEPDHKHHKRIDTELAQRIEDALRDNPNLPWGNFLNPDMLSRNEKLYPPPPRGSGSPSTIRTN
jgi:hypothetical protein